MLQMQVLPPHLKVKYIGKGKSSVIKKELAGIILILGTKKAMQMIKEQDLTPREYRTRREFIRDWFSKEFYNDYKLIENAQRAK